MLFEWPIRRICHASEHRELYNTMLFLSLTYLNKKSATNSWRKGRNTQYVTEYIKWGDKNAGDIACKEI
jgi:hypothetical protein